MHVSPVFFLPDDVMNACETYLMSALMMSDVGRRAYYCTSKVIMSNSTQKHGTLRVGTAGWTNDSWRGPFYPPGVTNENKLSAYQQSFGTVENNGTCHSMPSKTTVKKWKQKCGRNFQMAVKMVKHVTHEKDSVNQEALLRTFCDNVSDLGDNLGPILLQFPKTKQVTAAVIRSFARVIQNSDLSDNAKIAIEIRHADSTQDAAVLDELQTLGWCLVVHPNSIGRGTVIAENRQGFSESYNLEPLSKSWPITAHDWVYVRLHGTNDEHSGIYSDDELRLQAVPVICQWLRRGIDVYAYILCDNDHAGMPKSAKSLERLAHTELGTKIPRAPKQVTTITSFFGKKGNEKKRESNAKDESANSKRCQKG